MKIQTMPGALLIILTLLLTQAATGQSPPAIVDIRDFAFEPHEVKITVGTTVRWVNHDGTAHSVAMEGRPGSSPLIDPGKEHSASFGDPGRFTYRCGVHPTMLGIIVVD